jgi:hypothetical protein
LFRNRAQDGSELRRPLVGWFEKKDWFFISDLAGILRGLTSNMSYVTLFTD